MKPITTAEARQNLAEIVNRAAYAGERFVVTRHGKELVAIVPVGEASLLDRVRALLDRRDFDAAIAAMRQDGTRSWESVRRELDLGG